jgi:hypothetical protein
MPDKIYVHLIREEHAHFIRVAAVTVQGEVIAHYHTDAEDREEPEKLWEMEQNLPKAYEIRPPRKEQVVQQRRKVK